MSDINPQLWEQAKSLASRSYDIEISEDILSNGQRIYLVENPELEGCMAQGKTLKEAIDNLNEGRIDFIYFMLEDEMAIPAPNPTQTITATSKPNHFVSFPSASNKEEDHLVIDNEEIELDDVLDAIIQPDNRQSIMRISVIEGDFIQHG